MRIVPGVGVVIHSPPLGESAMPAIDKPDVTEPTRGEVVACRDARLVIRQDQGLTVIAIAGEIYASNVDDVSRHVRASVPRVGALIVDLSRIEFIGVEGVRVLFSLSSECARSNIPWVLVTNHCVLRLLRVGDPDGSLPTVALLTEAFRYVRRETPVARRLRLVAPTN
jgi:anti-anti-sigma factor